LPRELQEVRERTPHLEVTLVAGLPQVAEQPDDLLACLPLPALVECLERVVDPVPELVHDVAVRPRRRQQGERGLQATQPGVGADLRYRRRRLAEGSRWRCRGGTGRVSRGWTRRLTDAGGGSRGLPRRGRLWRPQSR